MCPKNKTYMDTPHAVSSMLTSKTGDHTPGGVRYQIETIRYTIHSVGSERYERVAHRQLRSLFVDHRGHERVVVSVHVLLRRNRTNVGGASNQLHAERCHRKREEHEQAGFQEHQDLQPEVFRTADTAHPPFQTERYIYPQDRDLLESAGDRVQPNETRIKKHTKTETI